MFTPSTATSALRKADILATVPFIMLTNTTEVALITLGYHRRSEQGVHAHVRHRRPRRDPSLAEAYIRGHVLRCNCLSPLLCVIEHAHVGKAPASRACILDASALPTRHLAVPNSLGAIVQTRHRVVPVGSTASSSRSCQGNYKSSIPPSNPPR